MNDLAVNHMAAKWNDRFNEAAKQSDDPVKSKAALSLHEALKIVRNLVERTDLEFQKREAKRGPIPEDIKRDIEIDLGISEQTIADPSNEEGVLAVEKSGVKLLAQKQIQLDLKDPVHDEFFLSTCVVVFSKCIVVRRLAIIRISRIHAMIRCLPHWLGSTVNYRRARLGNGVGACDGIVEPRGNR